MVCYAVPLAATVLISIGRKTGGKNLSFGHPSHSSYGFWLNIMMLGGAVFGVIDHAFSGELFYFALNWSALVADLAIGGAITAGIAGCWVLLVLGARLNERKEKMSRTFTGIMGTGV